jgi:hypothetical protein
MNKSTILKIILVLTLTLAFWLSDNKPASASPITTVKKEFVYVFNTSTTQAPKVHKQKVQARNSSKWDISWLATLQPPSNKYWDKVAQCETASNWKDRGKFAGGLGIYIQTWRGWGGQEFAPKQWLATRLEQITIANRIALHGWLAPNGYFQQPVGFNGWGCIKNNEYLKPPVPAPWTAWDKVVAKSRQRR